MFVKPYIKQNLTTGERYTVYKLVEGYRNNQQVTHRIIVSFGRLDELETDERKKLLGKRVEELIINGGNTLSISQIDEQIEQLAGYYYEEVRRKKRYDIKQGKVDWETVNLSTLKNKDGREIGAEWMCKQCFDQLGIGVFLRQSGWEEDKIALATTHIITRAVYPASELKTVSFIRENSAISEITGLDREKLTKDMLYGISHQLYKIKDPLEQYLSRRTNELFDLEDKIILYDLTNTYFEGRMKGSKIAKFGRSKEKRTDARLVVLAVVVNSEGFLKYSKIYQGNMADCKTLQEVISSLSEQTSSSGRKPIVVIDAGIATDDNLAMLKEKGYDYMCVSRSSLKQYHADTAATPVQVTDKRKQAIELLKVKVDGDSDQFLWVKSHAKKMKEDSMNGLLSQRFEEGIQNIQEGISKKGGTKKLNKVFERIGRLKQKYPSVHTWYDISVCNDGNGTATSINCRHKTGEQADSKSGIYFLRTSIMNLDEHAFWSIYNIIREIEYTFRVLKTDLDLRPIYHKTDEASMAHLNLGMLAYWLVVTIRYQLRKKGINADWREIVRRMNTQKCVTTSVVNIKQETISIRQCTEPVKEVKAIYDILKYKYQPFTRKKSVVPPAEFPKNNTS
ncbi:MAG: IS1634 family transposase [Bacteroidales bacterium]|nr:IS1634 family transposase [Bacteroidales bacterium]